MRKMTRFLLFVFSINLIACTTTNSEDASEKSVQEIKDQGKISNSDIIRNPVSAEEVTDTVNVAKLIFEEINFDFGQAKENDIIEHTFKFTNEGKVPLIINDARSTCGCTVPEWPKEPIEPGQGGVISVRFNTKGKRGDQKKPVTIKANTYPTTTVLYIEGRVEAAEGAEEQASTEK
ncbi:MAG: DUF1573 domain-containing protein [Bacteroidota bacterium]